MQKAGEPRKAYSLSHQKVVIDIDFRRRRLTGSTELYMVPLEEDLSEIRINARQSQILGVTINQTPCDFTYQDSLQESQSWLKDGTINNHLDYKRRWSIATAEDDEGEITIQVPRGMIVPSMDQDVTAKAPSVSVSSATPADANSPEPSTPQTPGAPPVLSTINFATLCIRIDFVLDNPVEGAFFSGPDPVNAPNRTHAVYAVNQPLPGATRLWLPSLDRLAERCTWDIDFIVPAYAPDEEDPGEDEEWSAEDYTEDEKVQVICSGDLIQQMTHHSIPNKSIFHYNISVPTPASSISFAAGLFEVIKLSQSSTDTSPAVTQNDDDISEQKSTSTSQVRGTLPQMFAFGPPGRSAELRNTCGFMVKAMEFFMHEVGSYPFSSFKLVFLEDAWAPTVSSATMALCSTQLLHPEDVIDQVYETRRLLTQALAQQWFGVHIVCKTWPDMWIIVGLANYITSLFLKKLFGNNEYRFRMKKDIERCCELDKDRPPLYNPGITFPIDQDDLNFVGLKAPLVLHMLDKRMSKSGSSLGLSRVIPKLLVSVMSGELTHNAIGTHWFLKTCRKVSGLETKGFSDQWIYNGGCPIFSFSYVFNRKKMVVEINMKQTSTNAGLEKQKLMVNQEHPAPMIFTGHMTARIHEADGTPYEHVLDIQDTSKRFEVQFNTKYKRIRRNTKRFQAKQAAAAAAAREAEEEGDIEDGIGALGFGVGMWEDDQEKEEWQVVEWGQDDENGAASATFEWIRLDAEFEWLCEMRFEQPDFMWAAQLQKDRDVVAQYEAIRALGARPSPAASTTLLKALLDTRIFFRARMECTTAIAKCASANMDWIGLLHLTKTFQNRYCYPPTHAETFKSTEPIHCMPKPNDFSSLAEYYVQKSIPAALSTIRDEKGFCPLRVRQFLLDILRFNDNTGNAFSDNYYVSTLISSLGHALIPDPSKIQDLDDDDEDEFEHVDESGAAAILAQALHEIERYKTLDYLIPTYHNTVTVSCLQVTMQLMLSGLTPVDLKMFMIHSRYGNFVDVRLAAFESLLLLGGLENSALVTYICHVIERDPCPYVRFHMAQSMAEILGVFMARDATVEGHDGLIEEVDGKIVRDDGQDGPKLQGMEAVRKTYGQQPALRKELWAVLTRNPFLENRVLKFLLVFCDILYPPGESIIPKLKFRLAPIEPPAPPVPVQPVQPPPAPISIASLPVLAPAPTPAPAPIRAPSPAKASKPPKAQKAPKPPKTTTISESAPSISLAPIYVPAPAQVVKQELTSPILSIRPTPAPIGVPAAPVAPAPSPPPPIAKATPKKAEPKPKPPKVIPSAEKLPQPMPTFTTPTFATPSFTTSVSKPPPPPTSAPPPPTPKTAAEERPRKTINRNMPPDHLKLCRKVWKKMMASKSSERFRLPVDPILENIPLYPQIVKRPMDLSTIKSKLDQGMYDNLHAFEDDVRLMLDNCFTFNQVGTYVYNEGQDLETLFELDWKECLNSVGARRQENNVTIVETPKNQTIAHQTISHQNQTISHQPHGQQHQTIPHQLSSPAVPAPRAPSPLVPTYTPPPVMASPKIQTSKLMSTPVDPMMAMSTPVKKKATKSQPPPVPVYSGASSSSSSGTVQMSSPKPSPASIPKEKPHSSQQSFTPASSSSSTPAVAAVSAPQPPVRLTAPVPRRTTTSELAKCKTMLKELKAEPCSFEFLRPVDPERQGIPQYPSIIKHPMDLGTIETRLKLSEYHYIEHVKRDLDQVIINCRTFNPRDSLVCHQADELEALVEKKWEAAFGNRGASMVIPALPKAFVGSTPGVALSPIRASASMATSSLSALSAGLSSSAGASQHDHSNKSKSKTVEKGSFSELDSPRSPSLPGATSSSSLDKSKSSSGKPAVAPATGTGTGDYVAPQADQVKHMEKILKKLVSKQVALPFLEPVDWLALNLPAYPELIKNPMDFGTIKKRISAGRYQTLDNFADDVRLVVQNCINFNGLDHAFSQGGMVLQTLMIKEVEAAKKELIKQHVLAVGGVGIARIVNKEGGSSTFNSSSLSASHSHGSNASTTSGATAGSGGVNPLSGKTHKQELKLHLTIVNRLKQNMNFNPFAVPVDPIALGIPTYWDVIKNPMDFGTIERKLRSHEYQTGDEVIRDGRLVFYNCATFNTHPEDQVAAMGEKLRKAWEAMIRKEGMVLPKTGIQSSPAVVVPPPVVASKPKQVHDSGMSGSTALSGSKSSKDSSSTINSNKSGSPKPKSSSSPSAVNMKMAPAYIPPSSNQPAKVISSPSTTSSSHSKEQTPGNNNKRRGSSTPAPTPLRHMISASSLNPGGGSMSASGTPQQNKHSKSTFGGGSPALGPPTGGSGMRIKLTAGGGASVTTTSKKHEFTSGSELSDPDDYQPRNSSSSHRKESSKKHGSGSGAGGSDGLVYPKRLNLFQGSSSTAGSDSRREDDGGSSSARRGSYSATGGDDSQQRDRERSGSVASTHRHHHNHHHSSHHHKKRKREREERSASVDSSRDRERDRNDRDRGRDRDRDRDRDSYRHDRDRERDYERERGRDRDRERGRDRGQSRSQSRSPGGRYDSRSPARSLSRERDRDRERSWDRDRDRSESPRRHKKHKKNKKSKKSKKHSRSRDRDDDDMEEDDRDDD